MLKSLVIKNLALIEHVSLNFAKGFTTITGETGSGKTAFIEAIRLLLGERASISKVRKGTETAFIQGSFELCDSSSLQSLFDQAGFALPKEEDLILNREIHISGKSRCFCCGQMVPLTFLQKLAPYLVDYISQHGHIYLKNIENQRDILDLYAGIDLTNFQSAWNAEKALINQLELSKKQQADKDRRKEILIEEIKELSKIGPEEEKTVFEEYTLLSNAQELLSAINAILSHSEEVLEKSNRISYFLEKILKYNSLFQQAQEMNKEAHLHFVELSSLLQSFQAKIEMDPDRLFFLEDRLKTFSFLKKKYGNDLIERRKKGEKELADLVSTEDRILEIEEQLKKAKETSKNACSMLTMKRKEKAQELEKKVSETLQKLNIPNASFQINIKQTTRSNSGEDAIEYFLRTNLGEKPLSVKDHSSGGELSRLLFSLKCLLKEKNSSNTFLFDEIDANVGGETASIIGKKLKSMGKAKQILCVTHFPQVASQGDHHLRVYKEEKKDRTLCKIEFLHKKSEEAELLRMIGGQSSFIDFSNSH